MPIHETTKGYETGAPDYVSGRPGYPPDALDWLCEDLRAGPGRTIVEVGAGTGKFIPVLKKTGARVIALEPVAAMRAQLAAAYPEIEAISGTAESIPLPDRSVDAVVCAQSFHWFATSAALQEMGRVLVDDGRLGLIWNGRDESVPWVAELSAITNDYEGDTPRYRTGDWRRVLPAPGFGLGGERVARNTHVGSPEQVIVKRTLSASFIAALPPDRQDEVVRRVRALIARTPALVDHTEVAFPYETRMLTFRKTPTE